MLSKISLSGVIAGFVLGIFVTTIFFVVLTDVAFAPSSTELIRKIKMIELGMTVDQARDIVGPGEFVHEIGTGFPVWASNGVPESFEDSHGVIVKTIGSIGPHNLLIFFDKDHRVVFVSLITRKNSRERE